LLVASLKAKPLQAGEAPTQRVVSIPDGASYWLPRPNHNPLDTNTAIENYYQVSLFFKLLLILFFK